MYSVKYLLKKVWRNGPEVLVSFNQTEKLQQRKLQNLMLVMTEMCQNKQSHNKLKGAQ